MRGLFLAAWLGGAAFVAPPAGAAASAAAPVVSRAGPRLVLEAVPDLLAEKVVEEELRTGLTTSFVFRVRVSDGRGKRAEGAGRLDVRYELWDEVFLISRISSDGRRRTGRLADLEELRGLWQKLDLTVLDASALSPRAVWKVEIEAQVIPFSRLEQRDTQRWFSDSLDASGSASGELEAAAGEDGKSVGRVLSLLMATSIQRRAVATFRWTVRAAPTWTSGESP